MTPAAWQAQMRDALMALAVPEFEAWRLARQRANLHWHVFVEAPAYAAIVARKARF